MARIFPDQRMSRMEALRSYTANMRTVRLRRQQGHVKGRQAGGYYGLVERYLDDSGRRDSNAKVDYTVVVESNVSVTGSGADHRFLWSATLGAQRQTTKIDLCPTDLPATD